MSPQGFGRGRPRPAYGYVLFHTSAAAFRAERAAQPSVPGARLVPTPRELSSDCGVALRFDLVPGGPGSSGAAAAAALELAKVPYDRIVAPALAPPAKR